MSQERPACVPFRMRPDKALKIIRQLAADSANIAWSQHARERMVSREISDRTAVGVLREGYIKGPVEPGSNPGEWKTKVCKEVKGRREVGVVIVIVRAKRLFVKTVEWEDL
jgi:hypothetical protein